MKIFTDDLIEKIQEIHNNTNMHNIINSEFFRKLLLNMDNVVARVPPEKRKDKIGKLMSKENFIQIYNELLVGYLFKEFDFYVEYEPTFIEYEPKCNEKPPDFRIIKDEQSIIVEVFTKNIDERSQKIDNCEIDLIRRIKKIPIGVKLNLSLSEIELKKFNSGTNKQIVNELGKWLKGKPQKGLCFTKYGIIFEVDHYDERSHATLKPGFSKGVSSDNLKDKYRKKYKQHSALINIMNIPYIIVCITNNFIEHGIPEFLEVIFGQVFPTITFDKKGNIIEESFVHQNNGLFSKFKRQKVSAVILINNLFNKFVIEIIRNENALHKLPVEIFPQFNWNENGIYGKRELPLA